MRIIIEEDPDGGFRDSKSRYWWEIVHEGHSIAQSTRADFLSYTDAVGDALEFLRLMASEDLSKMEVVRG